MIGILLACSPPLDGSSFTCPPPDAVCLALSCKKSSADSPTFIEDRDFTTYEVKTEIWRYEFKDPT